MTQTEKLREKIAIILKLLTRSYALAYIHNLNQLETEIKRVESCSVDPILKACKEAGLKFVISEGSYGFEAEFEEINV